ncbi:MAG: CPBP family intramembrane metalloprotease [Lachnospiraceae bacterium]|nr:CPBP family intramembrane metalloprotease [Lachnospiraceae bacterium]
MKKIYDKNELNFALIWIGIYVVLMSVGENISGTIGIAKAVTAPICVVLTLIMYFWISKNELKEKYGLCAFDASAKQFLYFVPLMLLVSTNLWWGFQLNLTLGETVLYVISMLCVGFLEEVIFRGFLFKAICKTNVKQAVIISSVTFGIGHIVNLLNGRDIPETLMQICYAVAIGFLFTIIFYKRKSLWPCIITHSVMNSLSVFANEDVITIYKHLAGCVFLCIVSIGYAVYILCMAEKADIRKGESS